MGAKQSKRSVDITTTPKKEGGENQVMEGEGKVEKIGDLDVKVTNGDVHKEVEATTTPEKVVPPETNKEEEITENGVSESEDAKTPDSEGVTGEPVIETEKAEEKTEEPTSEKKKEKTKKKKWSIRSISFSKKTKPSKDGEKNGDVKEEAEAVTSPETEAAPKAEAPKTPEPTAEAPAVTNGTASPEEVKPADEKPAAVVEAQPPKEPEQPKAEPPKEPAKVAEPLPAPVEPPKPEDPVSVPKEEPKPVEPVVEETKEVRNEEVPPPLPSSNPPSPVTVFAESTKALPVETVPIETVPVESVPVESVPVDSVPVETVPEPVVETPVPEVVPEPVIETVTAEAPVLADNKPLEEPQTETTDNKVDLPDEPKVETEPVAVAIAAKELEAEPVAAEVVEAPAAPEEVPVAAEPVLNEPVANADSLPDLSTESLPSLPEPSSESLPEPMSLPPVEAAPEPIAVDPKPDAQTPVSPPPPSSPAPAVTESGPLINGNTNGLPSPVESAESLSQTNDGPLKQIVPPTEEAVQEAENDRRDAGDKVAEASDAPPVAAVAE